MNNIMHILCEYTRECTCYTVHIGMILYTYMHVLRTHVCTTHMNLCVSMYIVKYMHM